MLSYVLSEEEAIVTARKLLKEGYAELQFARYIQSWDDEIVEIGPVLHKQPSYHSIGKEWGGQWPQVLEYYDFVVWLIEEQFGENACGIFSIDLNQGTLSCIGEVEVPEPEPEFVVDSYNAAERHELKLLEKIRVPSVGASVQFISDKLKYSPALSVRREILGVVAAEMVDLSIGGTTDTIYLILVKVEDIPYLDDVSLPMNRVLIPVTREEIYLVGEG